jgi:uncharacterized membrane protein YccC
MRFLLTALVYMAWFALSVPLSFVSAGGIVFATPDQMQQPTYLASRFLGMAIGLVVPWLIATMLLRLINRKPRFPVC